MRWRGVALGVAVVVGAAAAAAAPPEGTGAKLRSPDAAERTAGLCELVAATDEDLAAQRRALRPTLQKLLAKDPAPTVRGLAARVLARLEGADALPHLLAAVGAERDPEAEALLVEAFALVPADAARRELLPVARAVDDPRRAALAAEALGALPGGVALDDLVSLLDSGPPWAVAAGACLGLGRIEDLRSIEALLRRLRHPDAAVRSAARESLVLLLGIDCGTEGRRWDDWWAGARDGFKFPDRAPQGPVGRRDVTSDERISDGAATFARFFGIELRGRRIAFVVDYSQSMWGPRRAKAEAELVDAVKGLASTAQFSIVLFNERVWWFRDGPLPARPQEKFDLARYLPEQETKSYTNLHDALEAALGLLGDGAAARAPAPGLDEVVVLSDGVPNRGRIKEPDKILDAIRKLNAGRVRIHAVCLGDEPTDLLPRLAAENGGRYVSHPFPK